MSRRPSRHKRKRVVFNTPGRECPHADKGCCPQCLTGRPKQTLFGGARIIVTRRSRVTMQDLEIISIAEQATAH